MKKLPLICLTASTLLLVPNLNAIDNLQLTSQGTPTMAYKTKDRTIYYGYASKDKYRPGYSSNLAGTASRGMAYRVPTMAFKTKDRTIYYGYASIYRNQFPSYPHYRDFNRNQLIHREPTMAFYPKGRTIYYGQNDIFLTQVRYIPEWRKIPLPQAPLQNSGYSQLALLNMRIVTNAPAEEPKQGLKQEPKEELKPAQSMGPLIRLGAKDVNETADYGIPLPATRAARGNSAENASDGTPPAAEEQAAPQPIEQTTLQSSLAENASYYYKRANAFKDVLDYQGAIQNYNEAIKLNPEYAEAYYKRGLCYSSIGLPELAAEDFRKANTAKSAQEHPWIQTSRSWFEQNGY